MDKTKAIAGGGAWMIAAALQVVPQTWPNLLHPHPWAVGLFVLIGGVMFAYGAFGNKHHSSTPTNEGNIVGRDNSGRMIAHVEHYHEFEPVAPVIESEKPPLQNLKLSIDEPTFTLVCWTHISWQRAPLGTLGAMMGAVAWVYNPTADEGEVALDIRSAVATLIHRRDGLTVASISAAYWLGESGYEADFKAGQRRGILLGAFPYGFNSPTWHVVENPRRHQFRPDLRSTPITGYKQTECRIPQEIEIAIIENGITLRKFSVLLGTHGTGYKLSLAGSQ